MLHTVGGAVLLATVAAPLLYGDKNGTSGAFDGKLVNHLTPMFLSLVVALAGYYNAGILKPAQMTSVRAERRFFVLRRHTPRANAQARTRLVCAKRRPTRA